MTKEYVIEWGMNVRDYARETFEADSWDDAIAQCKSHVLKLDAESISILWGTDEGGEQREIELDIQDGWVRLDLHGTAPDDLARLIESATPEESPLRRIAKSIRKQIAELGTRA